MHAGATLLLILLAIAASGCGGRERAAAQAVDESAPAQVTVAHAERVPIVDTITVSGTLAAEEQVMLSLKVTGRIEELLVDLGTPVRRGQVIARLTPTDFELRRQQAEAALQQARARLGLPVEGDNDQVEAEQTGLVRSAQATLVEARNQRDRIATFVTRGISAKAELDTANAALEIAEARHQDALEEVRNRQAVLAQRRSELALARQQLDDTILRSPIDGVVRERMAVAGEFRSAGTPVVTVVRQDPLRLQLGVPERSAGVIKTGQVVRVNIEGDATVHQGRVVRLSPSIAEGTRTLAIEASVPNPGGLLRPGSFARAEIVVSETPGLVVPQSAVLSFAGVEKVLTVEDGKAREHRIRTGRHTGDRVEILDGLPPDAVIIVNGGAVADGAAVAVVR
jgi:multidrug efflux pump subunit AcrA (membrane-fusion protein)